MLGAGLLWFGWFGFNVGSALSLNDVALTAFINTNIAAAASALTWMLSEWFFQSKPTRWELLAALFPPSRYYTSLRVRYTFLSSSYRSNWRRIMLRSGLFLKTKFGYDDTLDAFGCHGIGGTWGGIATGLFATTTVNSDGANGLFYGNAALLLKQLVAIGATYAFTIIMTYAIIKAINFFLPVRVDEHEEHMGLDISMHERKLMNILSE